MKRLIREEFSEKFMKWRHRKEVDKKRVRVRCMWNKDKKKNEQRERKRESIQLVLLSRLFGVTKAIRRQWTGSSWQPYGESLSHCTLCSIDSHPNPHMSHCRGGKKKLTAFQNLARILFWPPSEFWSLLSISPPIVTDAHRRHKRHRALKMCRRLRLQE